MAQISSKHFLVNYVRDRKNYTSITVHLAKTYNSVYHFLKYQPFGLVIAAKNATLECRSRMCVYLKYDDAKQYMV